MRKREIKIGMLVDVKVEDPNFDWTGSRVAEVGTAFILIKKGAGAWWISHLHLRPHIEGGAWAKKETQKEGSLAWAIAQAKAGKSIRRKGVGDKTWRMRKTENGWKRKAGNEPWEACGCPEAINAKDQTWEVYSEPAEKCAHCGQTLPKKSLEEKVFCMMRESRSKGETLVREIIAMVRDEIAKEGKR